MLGPEKSLLPIDIFERDQFDLSHDYHEFLLL